MVMDKTWTHNNNMTSTEFRRGVREFINICTPLVNEDGMIKCLCNRCLNVKSQKLRAVEIHIHKYGFDESYDIWSHHGESLPQYQHQPGPSTVDFGMIAHMEDWRREEEEKEKDDDDDDDREEEGDGLSFIESFRKNHTDRESGKWVNEAAKSDYIQLLDAKEAFIIANPGKIVDVMAERAIMREVFGKTRGYEPGFGAIIKGSRSATIHDIPESSCGSAETCEVPHTILIKRIEGLSKELAELRSKFGMHDGGEEEEDVDADERGLSSR